MNISFCDIYKEYSKDSVTVSGFNLKAGDGELVVLLGPEGCGSSDVLKMAMGLEPVSRGEIYIDGVLCRDTPPGLRGIASVSGSYRLYPEMTVLENLSFWLKLSGEPPARIEELTSKAMELADITALADKMPAELSKEQRQRVVLARAVARGPRAIMLDHPLSGFAKEQRPVFEEQIKRLHKKSGITFLYATDDPDEAMNIADRIVIMRNGEIQQDGSPAEIYNSPENLFVASYVGHPAINLFDARASAVDGEVSILLGEGHSVCSFVLPHRLPELAGEVGASRDVIVGIRPEHLREIAPGDENGEPVIMGKLRPKKAGTAGEYLRAEYFSSEVHAKILDRSNGGGRIPGKACLLIDTRRLYLFDRHTFRRLYSAG